MFAKFYGVKDTKSEIIERFLTLARLIRRRGTPDEAEFAVVYERQFEKDLADRHAELARTQTPELSGLGHKKAA